MITRIPVPANPRLRHSLSSVSLAALLAASFSSLAAAQQSASPNVLPTIVISPTTLPTPEAQVASSVTPVQGALIEIWRQVLGVEQVGLHDDFFDLGGHSVLVTQITSRVRQVFEIDLTMRHLFGAPTVAALAKIVEELLDEQLKQLSQEELTQLAAGTAKEVV